MIGFDASLPMGSRDLDAARRTLDDIAETGATALRTGVSPWLAAPEDLAFVRTVLDHARDVGLQVMITLAQLANNPEEDWSIALPKNLDYIGSVADALGDAVTWWQVLNEWDGADWIRRGATVPAAGTPQREEYLARTALMLRAARGRIRQACRQAVVTTTVMGTTADDATEQRWYSWYDGLVSRAVDAIGVNVYPERWQAMYDALPSRLRRVSSRYGLPVIVAEIGLPSTARDAELPEEERGEYLAHMVARAAESAEAVFVYQWQDRTDVTGSEARFGVRGKAALPALADVLHGR